MFKSLQRVALTETVRNLSGHPVKAGTHLTVVRQDGDVVTLRQDRKPNQTNPKPYRVEVSAKLLAQTFRGRPKGVKNKPKV